MESTPYKIKNTKLWINVYPSGSWHLTKQVNGKRKPISPLEAGYKKHPEIDTMRKLDDLAKSYSNVMELPSNMTGKR